MIGNEKNQVQEVSGQINTSSTFANRDGNLLERTEYLIAIIEQSLPLTSSKNDIVSIEQNTFQTFSINLTDINGNPIIADDIDITSISVLLEKSIDGIIFSSLGINQPIFVKFLGKVYTSYQFLSSQWYINNVYKLTVSGIKATSFDVIYNVPTFIWTDLIVTPTNIDEEVNSILTLVTNIENIDIPEIKSKVDISNVNIGDASSDVLKSIVAKLGNDTFTLKARLDALVSLINLIPNNPLLTNDSRLNNLNATISSRLASSSYVLPDNQSIADIKLLLINTKVNSSFTYLDTGREQTIFEITNSTKTYISQIMLDLSNLTQSGIIKIYSKIDGINYRELCNNNFNILKDSLGFFLDLKIPINISFKITYTENNDENSDRIIPYNYILED